MPYSLNTAGHADEEYDR